MKIQKTNKSNRQGRFVLNKEFENIVYLSPAEFSEKWSFILGTLYNFLDEKVELLNEFNSSYPIKGILIAGSWAESIAKSKVLVSTISDLDLAVFSSEDPVGFVEELKNILTYRTRNQITAIRQIEVIDEIRYTESSVLNRLHSDRDVLSGPLIFVATQSSIGNQGDAINEFINATGLNVVQSFIKQD